MGSWVHPLLGKPTIGLGTEIFSMSSFGRRCTSAIPRPDLAMLTAPMPDLHVVCWVALGFLLLLCDRRWIDRRTDAVLEALTREGSDVETETDNDAEMDTEPGTATEVAHEIALPPAPMRVPSPFFR